MSITAEQKFLLNRYMGPVAAKVQLGTLLDEAGSVSAGEITLANGKLLVGAVSGFAAAQTMSGDATISNSGVLTLGAGVIGNGNVAAGAAIAFSKLAALPSAQVLVGNGSNVAAAVAVSGAVTISNAGVVAIANDAVSLEHLDSGIEPSHVVKFGGTFSSVGGAATEVFAVVGVLATDLVFLQLKDDGPNNVSVLSAVAGVDQVTVVFSADPGAATLVYYQVQRAAS